MAKNYMADVAKIFGVELNEEFKLKKHAEIYKFTEEGLMYYPNSSREWRIAPFTLNGLLRGEYEVEKLPWRPKYNEKYYRPGLQFIKVFSEFWANTVADFAYKETGMVFRTAEECEAALPELRKKYLGGDDNV